MTASNSLFHGTELGECCTNVYALTDLCGLRWRKYVGTVPSHLTPSDDPVLKSLSAALAQDVLCAWRGSPSTGNNTENGSGSLLVSRELWVFWFHEDPNLQGIIGAELKESSRGYFEDVLPHEPRSMFFKALHNLLERCLLSNKFVRLGKWFEKPLEKDEDHHDSSSYLSVSFSFFVLGESTVCTAVETQQRPKVTNIRLEDVALAASRPEGLSVLLCPYGLTGTLTGHSSNEDGVNALKMLEKWRKFYPTHVGTDWKFPVSQLEEQDVPLLVQVLVGEVQMWYPSAHVMIQCQQVDAAEAAAPGTDAPTTISLTPPASPSDPTNTDVAAAKHTLFLRQPTSETPEPTTLIDKKKLTQSLVQEMWQETTTAKSASRNSSKSLPSFKPDPCAGSDVNLVGQWEFEEPFKRTSCSCTSSSNISRPKPPTQMRSFGIPTSSSITQSPQQQQQQQQQVQTTAKLKKEKKKNLTPFHHRPPVDREGLGLSRVGTVSKGLPTVNALTALTQKRHAEVAGTNHTSKKYSWHSQTPAGGTPCVGGKLSKTVSAKENFLLTHLDFPLKKVDVELCSASQGVTLSKEGLSHANWRNSHETKARHKAKHDYVLPKEGSFDLPVLPVNSLDCRCPLKDMLSIPKCLLYPLQSAPIFFEKGTKRPSTDGEIEPAPSPSKRQRAESSKSFSGASRHRSDSSSSGRLRGRRNSSLLVSPAATPLSDPFTPQSDEMETELIQPPIKSPTQKGRPRRRSSNASPAAPSPAPAEHPKPSSIKQRRQSLRKQQQEESKKEKHQQEPRLRQRASRTASFEQADVPALPGSPPTPSALPSLMTAKGLMVTASDLDRLFDTDEEEEDEGIGNHPAHGTNSHSSHNNFMSDGLTLNSHQTVQPMGTVASTDLARMFPTPPSLEPVAHSPPSAGSEYMNPGSVKALLHGTSPEAHHLMQQQHSVSDGDLDKLLSPKELSPVFEVPETEAFPVSYSFEAVEVLPSSRSPMPPLPQDCVYQPTWQILSKQDELLTFASEESIIPVVELPTVGDNAMPSPVVGYSYLSPPSASSDVRHLTSVAMSPVSPASSMSSLSVPPASVSKPLGSAGALRPKLLSSALPQVDALSRVLSLSDSVHNYFSDKNYDSVNLCTCSCRTSVKNESRRKPLVPAMNFNKCSCGFGALEGAKFSKGTGLFPEDEVGGVNRPFAASKTRKPSDASANSLVQLETAASNTKLSKDADVSASLLEIILDQCSSPFSCSTLRYQLMYNKGCASKNGLLPAKQDHKLPCISPAASVAGLYDLRSLMQTALQRSTSRKTWEQPNGTAVQGPLSWKQLHHLATRGLEPTPKAQPIPSVVVGNGGDWLTLSPFAVQFWDKLLLEPYSSQRDVAYIVVSPDNEAVINSAKMFCRELSSVYETCQLGRHVPVMKKLRDGVLRVGQKAMLKVSKESVHEWFNQKSNTPEGARLKLYAQVCKHLLGPLLWSLASERHLLDQEKTESKFGETEKPNITPLGDGGQRTGSGGNPISEVLSSAFSAEEECEQNSQDVPTLVVYLLDPFSSPNTGGTTLSSYVGLLRCLSEVAPLSDHVKRNVIFQIVPVDQVLLVDTLTRSRDTSFSFAMQLKCLAFSVFSRCRKTVVLCPSGKSLTGFGPAARHEALVKQRESGNETLKLYSSPYILSNPAFMETNPTEADSSDSLAPVSQMPTVLFCGYCLSHDQRWLLAVCTDRAGEMVETCAVSVDPLVKPDGKLRKTSARRKALLRLWEFCLGVISGTLTSWKLVVNKLGRMGPGELKDWREILSKTSLDSCRHDFSETCNACWSVSGPKVLGVSVMSLEPEPAVRMYMAKGVLAQLLHSSRMSVAAVAKPDVPSTYITVFPTTSLAKPSSRSNDSKAAAVPDTTTEQPVTDTDILLAGADDDENDEDPLRTLIPLMTSPDALSPGILGSSPVASPMDSSPMRPSPPQGRPVVRTASPAFSVQSPFQPIARASPFQAMQSTPSPSVGNLPCFGTQGEGEDGVVVTEPVAQGYFISTMQTGKMPSTFWANCGNTESTHPVILKASLYINTDAIDVASGLGPAREALGTQRHCDVLRNILKRFDALSWLTVDPASRDRRSCLPVHLCMLSHLYETFSALLENNST